MNPGVTFCGNGGRSRCGWPVRDESMDGGRSVTTVIERRRLSKMRAFVAVCVAVACGNMKAEPHEANQEARFVQRSFVDRSIGERRYLVFVPGNFSRNDRRPLLLFLNGFGESGDDGI